MANNYQEYNDYLKKMQDQMISRAETIEYNPQSASTLKSALAKALRPDVDRAIQSRQKTAAQNRAAIDADAAARGMGSSTWVTDVKNRQNDAAASDISNLEGDYISTLYGNLLNRMGAQEQNKLSVDQFNASQRQAALDRAQAATDQWWQTWKKKPTTTVNPNPGEDTVPDTSALGALIAQYKANSRSVNTPYAYTGYVKDQQARHEQAEANRKRLNAGYFG